MSPETKQWFFDGVKPGHLVTSAVALLSCISAALTITIQATQTYDSIRAEQRELRVQLVSLQQIDSMNSERITRLEKELENLRR